jgi:pimeloyl-ACP methyl ester carboxylesterase
MVGKVNTITTEDHYITVNSHRFAVRRIRISGKSNSHVLVFLHEGLGCIELWRDFPEQICRETGLDGFVYDRLGHGKSDSLPHRKTSKYLHNEALHYLPPLLEACTINEPLLIGHSDGGSIALLHAAYYPDKTAGVITEAAHVFVEDITIEGIKRTVKHYETGKLKDGLAQYHGSKTDLLFRGWANIWLSPEFRTWNIVDELKWITAPTLIIQGTEDEYGTEKQVDAIVNTVSGTSEKLIIPDCGHVPHRQANSIVVERVTEFINL